MLDSLINAYQSLAAVNPLSHIAGMTLSLSPAHVCVCVCVREYVTVGMSFGSI